MRRRISLLAVSAVVLATAASSSSLGQPAPLFGGAEAGGDPAVQQAIDVMNRAYYRLYDQPQLNAFQAVYTLETGGRTVGRLTMSWNRNNPGDLKAEFSGDDAAGVDVNDIIPIIQTVKDAWQLSLLGRFAAGRKKPAGPVEGAQAFAEQDVETLVISPDGQLKEVWRGTAEEGQRYIVQSQKINERFYVDNMKVERRSQGAVHSLEALFSYTMREGYAVISQLQVSHRRAVGVAAGAERQWLVKLQPGAFAQQAGAAVATVPGTGTPVTPPIGTGTPPVGPETPGTPAAAPIGAGATIYDWDSLSQQLIPRLLAANHSNADFVRAFKSLKCEILANVSTGPMAPVMQAKLRYEWTDADENGTLTDAEVMMDVDQVTDDRIRPTIRALQETLLGEAKSDALTLLQQHTVKTQQTPQGYIMTLTQREAAGKPIRLTISPDMRVLRLNVTLPNGIEFTEEYRHVQIAGRWALAARTRTTVMRALTTRETWTMDYYPGEIPFLRTLSIQQTLTTFQGDMPGATQRYVFHNWQPVARAMPLPSPALPGQPAAPQPQPGFPAQPGTAPAAPGGDTMPLFVPPTGTAPAGQPAYKTGPNLAYDLLVATMAYRNGKDDEAISLCTQALASSTNHPELLNIRACAYEGKGEHEKADADFALALKVKPDFAEGYAARGGVLWDRSAAAAREGRIDDSRALRDRALADLNKAIELDNRCKSAYLFRARLYTFALEYDKAWNDVKAWERIAGEPMKGSWFDELKRCSGRTE